MQNSTLPIFTGTQAASNNAAPPRQNNAPAADGAQFAQTLSRQIEQRQLDARLDQPAQPIKVTNTPVTPVTPPAAPAVQAQPPTQVCNAPDSSATSQTAAADTDAAPGAGATRPADDDGGQAGASPMADLIAMVASFNPAAAPVLAEPADAGSRRPDQLAAQSDLLAAADPRALAPMAVPAHGVALPAPKGEAAQSLSQLFDRARPGARTAAIDTAAGAGAKAAPAAAAMAAASPAAAAALAANPAAAADSKAGAFAGMLQAGVDAVPGRAGERGDLPALHEPAPASPLSAPLQQASLAVAQAAATPTDPLSARVGTPAWDKQLGQKVIFMAAGQDQSATLTLNPPDLGPLQVVLSISNDQAQVTFSAAQPEVRAALESALPKLREMMSESGISLGNASVNDGSAEQGQARQGEQARGQGGRGGFGGNGQASAATVEAPVRRGRVLGGAGAVDTFA